MRPSRVCGTPRLIVLAALASTVSTAGCSDPGVTAAAFPEPVTTLRIGVPDSPGRYSYEVTEEFARRVTEASNGGLRLEVEDTGIQEPRWNQKSIDQVQTGALDLLVVQSQAFDAIGVDSFTALYVPFLITDDEHLDAVVTSDLAGDMLAGLEGTGLTGLGIVPGGMRHLFNDTRAPTLPADIAGDGVRVAYSETIWSLVEAVGGRPDDPNGGDLEAAFRDGRVSHLDSTFALADGFLATPQGAADIPLYPLTFTIVANAGVMGDLPEEQRNLLATTASEVAQWAAHTRPSGAEDARDLCERNPGAEVVVAGPEALAQWRAATAGFATELRSDANVDELAGRIERIGADLVTRAEPVRACSGSAVAAESGSGANVPETFPEGTYRKDVSAEELLAQGANPGDAYEHAGVWTLHFRDGVFGDPEHPGCPGSSYEIVDNLLVITLGPEGPECGTAAGLVLFSSGWRLEGERLTFTDVRSGQGSDVLVSGLFGGEPWTRIG